MKHILTVATFFFLVPAFALADDYYWRIGQCQSGVQSEACDGKIISLSLTDATHYGELKLINLPISIGEAMTLSSCDKDIESLGKSLKYYDFQNPYTTYNTDPVMIRDKNEERFDIVLKYEGKIESCIKNHPKLLEEEAQKEAEEEAQAVRLVEIDQAIKDCDIDFFDDEMIGDERMATYDERMACEEKSIEPQVQEPIVEVVAPVVISAPVLAEPAVTKYVPSTPPVEVTSVPERVEDEGDVNATSVPEATTTEEVISVTQDELDKMVEERIIEKQEEAQIEPEQTSEPKPSIIKRITSFLFGWMF